MSGPTYLAESGGFHPPDVQQSFFPDPWYVNGHLIFGSWKAMILLVLGVILIIGFFAVAGRRSAVLPGKLQFTGEGLYGFIRNGVAIEIMGRNGRRWASFLATLFLFILVMNLWELVPVAQMPVTAHMAVPAFLAILVWLIYNFVGIRKHGFFGYLKLQTFIPGIPWAMHLLLIPIEFLSNIILRPFTQAIRLFANMFAGHMLVGVASAGTVYLLFESSSWLDHFLGVLPALASLLLVFFELLVCALQAYVFTLLAAIYIEGSLADSH